MVVAKEGFVCTYQGGHWFVQELHVLGVAGSLMLCLWGPESKMSELAYSSSVLMKQGICVPASVCMK